MNRWRLCGLASLGAACMLLAPALPVTGQTPPADSLTLDRAVTMALEHSAAVRQAQQAIGAAKARTDAAHSALLPYVEVDASYRRVDPTITVDFPVNGTVQTFAFFPNNNYEAAVTAQQTLYDFGRTAAREDAAHAAEQSAVDAEEGARKAVGYQTVSSFNMVLLLERNIAVIDEQIAALEENLRLAQQRLEQGTATNFDLLSTQVRLTSVRNQRVDVEGNLVKWRASLRRLVGAPLSAPMAVKGGFTTDGSAPDEETLVAAALKARPEYVAAKDAENTARLQVEAARRSDGPALTLSVSGGVKNGFPPDLNAPKLNWAGGVRFSLPLFDGNRTRAAEQEAQANLAGATAAAEEVEGTITMEVQQAAADLQTSSRRLATVDMQVQQAGDALALARTRYTNGVITNLELLNAQAALQEAEFLRVQYQYSVAMSRLALARATGARVW
ncbi:MAG TPA: TolC family protein [Candidatus Kapabacteria bacterium]|nr:TolC family protein [Candidatus Kapabacteria bacterium]